MRLMASLIAALTAAASAAVALEAGECPAERHADSQTEVASPPRDLGANIVMQVSYGPIVWGEDSVIKFTNCASGETLRTQHRMWMKIGSADPETGAFTVMQASIVQWPDTVFEKTVESAALTGDTASIGNDGRETCGCAAFYPDLRGEKEPWLE